uniref:DH domain-containing protein n=1 Tax=Rhabditophanes sp. KR3021 TaxID=114890 RepID=A0AC35TZR7_9BILA
MSTPALEQQELQTRPIMSMHGPSKSLDSTFVRNGQRSPIINQESSDNMCMLEDSSGDEASFEDIKSPHSDTDQTYSLIDIKSLGNTLENGHFDCPDEPEAKAPSLPGRPNGSVMIPSVSIDEPSHSPDLSELLRTASTKPSLFNKRDEKCRSQIFESSFKSPKQYLSSSTCNLADLSDGINEVDAEFEGLPGPSNFNGARKFSFIPDEVTHQLNSNNKDNLKHAFKRQNFTSKFRTLQGGVTKNGSKGKLVGKDKSIVKPAKTGAFSLFNKFKQQKDPVTSLIKQTGAPKPATISGATSSRITASLKEVSAGDHRYSTLPEAKKNKSSVELQAIGSNLIEDRKWLSLPDLAKWQGKPISLESLKLEPKLKPGFSEPRNLCRLENDVYVCYLDSPNSAYCPLEAYYNSLAPSPPDSFFLFSTPAYVPTGVICNNNLDSVSLNTTTLSYDNGNQKIKVDPKIMTTKHDDPSFFFGGVKKAPKYSSFGFLEDFIRHKIVKRISERKYCREKTKMVKASSVDIDNRLPDAMKSAIGQAITPTGSLKAKQRDSRTSISEHKISVSSSFIEQKMAVIGEEMLQCERWAHLFSSWAPEDISWRKMPACKKLSTSESKKQNIIREFISTERNHCYVLIILQQYFYANLKKERIFVNDTDMPFIAPAVIETLLKFHLELCQKLKNRMEENVVIDTISDIVLGEMKNEAVIGNVIKAYTDFCSSKEESKRLFNFNKTKSQKFKDYVHRYDSDPKYKAKDFKSCLDLVAHRLTKYPLLLDAIMKAEKNEMLKEEAGLAAEAARQLTSQVDDDLNKCEINKRWDSIRQSVDRNSVGQFEGATFTLHDLLFQDPNDPRKVLCIGKVTYKALNGSKNDLILVLFDDILVFFLCKNSKVYFFDLDQHQAIFGIEKTLVRVIERQNSIAIVYNDKANMDMTTVSFSNKADLEQWTTALLTAKKQPIGYVRKAPNNATGCYMDRVLTNTSATDLHSFGLDGETLQKYNIWWAVTEKLFAKRQLDDEIFGKYVVDRISWFQELKKHIVTMPFAKARQIPLKTMQALYDKFDELNRVKITDGEEYVAVMKKLEKEDVKALFDSWNGIFGKDDSDDSDCSSSRGKCVKRVSTYGGEGDKARRKDIVDKIRRHTTVPEIKSELRGIYPTSGDLATFAAIKGDASRKAAEMVLSENILMRSELIKLRNDLAKAELQKEAIKNSKGADFFSNTDEMEKLRTKNNEVFERERKFYIMQEKWTREAEEREEACRKRVEEREEACRKLIEEHEEAHKKREQTILLREADIDEKWLAAYKNRGNPSNTIYSDSDFPTSPLTPDPEMTGLPGPGIYEQPISKPLSHSKDGLRPHLSSSRSDLTRSASALSKNHKLGTHFLFHNHSDNTQQPSSNPTTSSKQLMSLVSKSETVTTKTKKK